MTGDELACRSCGELFDSPRPVRGPRAAYCSPRCRQAAYRERLALEVATEVADLALSSPHPVLAEALSAVPRASLRRVRGLLRDASDRNLSLRDGDGLCSPDTPHPRGVVAGLHKET